MSSTTSSPHVYLQYYVLFTALIGVFGYASLSLFSSTTSIRANYMPSHRTQFSPLAARSLGAWFFLCTLLRFGAWYFWGEKGWYDTAVLALAFLVVTLRHYDGVILTTLPRFINFNTVIAIIGATIKAAILLPVAESISELKWSWYAAQSRKLGDFEDFDAASRGSWGAFMLIFRLRSRYALSPQKFYKQLLSTSSHIVTLGAWITVLAIGLDPFTQQLFRPVVCEHGLRDGIARIPRATNLTGTTVNAANNVAPDLASAIYTGLLGDARKINFECSTGNCTFPGNTTVGSFQTIGLDAGCVDISSELAVENKPGDNSRTLWYLPALGNSTKAIGQWAGPAGTYGTTWSSPFTKHWPWERDIALYSFAALLYVTDHECAEVQEAAFGSTCSQPGFGSNCSLAAFRSKWNCSHALAVECKLWPTIQTIHAQIDLSEIKEEVVASGPMTLVPDPRAPSNRSWQDSWLEVPEETIQDGERKACTPSMTYTADTPVDISNNAFWTFYDKIDKPVPSNLTWYADECVFWIPPGAGGGLADFLDTLFDRKQLKGLHGTIATANLDGDVWIKNLYENGNATLHTVQARSGPREGPTDRVLGEELGNPLLWRFFLVAFMTRYDKVTDR
ncbi:hypothetical protein IQ06DRAFT_349535 [Phaeosphaeriaceae sp. SRC1lsM3a]|nr:hypothetical protein IQ06DRAFT_349535 [Stagonospora sp. SRC1lsM3a]